MAASNVIANLKIMLSASWMGLRSDFGKAGNAVKGFGKQTSMMGGVVSGVMSKINPYLSAMAIAAAALGALTWGTKLAAEAESAHVAFTTLLGSAEQATELMTQLQEFAASTPFQLDELVEGGRKLTAFGVAAGDVVPQMKMLGDLAAGIGAPIGELAEIYGKAKVAGRLMAEDINQLLGRGIPVVQALADTMGVSAGEIKKMVSEGKVGFPELQTALQHLTGEGSMFGGMMEKQSQTLNGLWSTFKDNVAAVMREFANDAIVPALKDALRMMIDLVAMTAEAYRFWKDMFGFESTQAARITLPTEEIQSMGEAIEEATDSIGGTLKDYATEIKRITQDIDKMMARHSVGAMDRRSASGFEAVQAAKHIQDTKEDRANEMRKRILAALEEANELKRREKPIEVARRRV